MLEKIIKFTSDDKDFIPHVKPSVYFIQEEYKKFSSFAENDMRFKTVKKCIPFLDALTCGYIIPVPFDLLFTYDEKENMVHFDLPSQLKGSGFEHKYKVTAHKNYQSSPELRYNKRTVDIVFKFENPWHIKTPPGYSCIFTQPFNKNSLFKIIDGIVDTDTYPERVNFPFYWTNPAEEQVLLKRGEPMALVIPFKRQSWKHTIGKEDLKRSINTKKIFFGEFIEAYKKNIWSKKSFK